MKKQYLRILSLLLAITMVFCACAQPQASDSPCVHTDINTDYICDNCQATLEKPACTEHIDSDSDHSCDTCGSYVADAVNEWLLDGIPAYNGGKLSKNVYLTGQGIDSKQLLENEGKMQLVSNTTYDEYASYVEKLEKAGFVKEFYRGVDGNFFASYVKDYVRVYAYFMCRTREARIIQESTKVSSSLADFGYVYEKKQGEQSVIYQLALPMNDETHPKPNYKDNGMFYLIKLADNSIIFIDGGNGFSKEQCDYLLDVLLEITGSKKGDKIKIAGWFITHSHGDHTGGVRSFLMRYSAYIDLERVFFALPSLTSTNEAITSSSGPGCYRTAMQALDTYLSEDPDFLRLHTGQVLNLADVSFEVLQTQEDLVNASTGVIELKDYNDVSTVLKITIDGETFLILGDIATRGANKLTDNWSGNYLRVDGVQLAHHVMNDLTNLYNIVQAPVLLVPQSVYGINIKDVRVKTFNVAKSYAREDMIFFQNVDTVGIAVVNGQWEKVYSKPLIY